MKKIKFTLFTLLISFLILNSCVVLDKFSTSVSNIDLTQFEKEGIFVTTGDFFQDYKSISILAVQCYEGFYPKEGLKTKNVDKENKQYEDNIYGSTPSEFDKIKNYNYKTCELEDLFSELINQAKQKGANGIIKLEIRSISKQGENPKTMQNGIEIVGLAVKIEK